MVILIKFDKFGLWLSRLKVKASFRLYPDEVLQLKKWIKDNPKIVKEWESFKHGKKQ